MANDHELMNRDEDIGWVGCWIVSESFVNVTDQMRTASPTKKGDLEMDTPPGRSRNEYE